MTNFLPPAKIRLIDRDGDISSAWLLWAERVARRLDAESQLSVPVDPPNILAGGTVQNTITVGDARPGDYATATFVPPDPGVVISADVTAANQVTVTFRNVTAGPIDLPAGTIFLRMERRR